MLELRNYQQLTLDSLERFLHRAGESAVGPSTAFEKETERREGKSRRYLTVPQLPELPYVCLRVPTGGGKTLMACHALGIAANNFLHNECVVCLWLVPTNTIREQTLTALRDRKHPYRQALASRFAGPVTVLDLTEALYVQAGTLAGETCVIVSTLAALRVEETEGRKVYETNGALQHHFSGLTAEQDAVLERNEDGTRSYSLANVLRLHAPIVIMDEAHNARTPLSFDTLARFRPSCIIEFTATPETTHDPGKQQFASNVLCHVSALELKAEQMVKLPIKLQADLGWPGVVAEALACRQRLEEIAREEEQQTGEYIRPIALLQAQAKSSTKETITVEVLKKLLLDEFKIPEDQIAIATGSTRELENVDLFNRACPIKFIITVQALKEGWDCSFAYVLCSVAEISSAKAVEQILGRILRLPHARTKQHEELNCSYAFATKSFDAVARTLTDALVENGFERLEAKQLVTHFDAPEPTLFPLAGLFNEVSEVVSEPPNLTKLDDTLRQRVSFDEASGTITVAGLLTVADEKQLTACFKTSASKEAVKRLAVAARRTPNLPSVAPRLSVPQLAIRRNGQLELFDESHVLDAPWKLSTCDVELSEADFPSDAAAGTAGEVDVTARGRMEYSFVGRMRRQLQLVGIEPGWDVQGLTNWFDRQTPHPDITRTEATLFIHRALSRLMETRQLTVEQLAQRKYRLRDVLAAKIETHRSQQSKREYERLLFGDSHDEITVDPSLCFHFEEGRYAANWTYDGPYRFQKHLFPQVGELKSEGEEYDCAVFLDQLAEVSYWVRNLERRPTSSFWLQTATDRFYPDFVAMLKGGRILLVESKGLDRWSNDDSKEKRTLGELWASRSDGKCLFVMPNGPDWKAITAAVRVR